MPAILPEWLFSAIGYVLLIGYALYWLFALRIVLYQEKNTPLKFVLILCMVVFHPVMPLVVYWLYRKRVTAAQSTPV